MPFIISRPPPNWASKSFIDRPHRWNRVPTIWCTNHALPLYIFSVCIYYPPSPSLGWSNDYHPLALGDVYQVIFIVLCAALDPGGGRKLLPLLVSWEASLYLLPYWLYFQQPLSALFGNRHYFLLGGFFFKNILQSSKCVFFQRRKMAKSQQIPSIVN